MNTEHAETHRRDNPPQVSGVGLLNEPFADTAAGHFFYADTDGAQRLDLMLHLAPYSPLLVIAGKPGVGKTALLRQFMARANGTWRVAVVTARVDMGRDELLRDMARGFGLPLDDRNDHRELYTALIAQLRSLRQNAQVPILLLDDAQYLSAAMMELLLKLCEENDAGHILSILLFGTPQLQNLLDSPALSSLAARVTHTFEVTPFTEQETGDYIRHRLKAAGAADDGPFDSMLINKIHAGSGGIPARINEMAQRVLSDKTPGGRERKPARDKAAATGSVKRLVVLMAALAVVVLMVAGPLRTLLFKPAPPAPSAPQKTSTLELPPPVAGGEEARVIRPAGPETAPVSSAKPETPAPTTEEVKPLPLPPLAATESAAVPKPAAPAAVPQSEAPPAAAKPPVKAENGKPSAAEIAKPQVAEAEKAKAPVVKEKKPESNGLRGEEWVRAQPNDHFTLQLMALKEEKTARQFIELHHLQDKAAYIAVRHDGQILYTLLYGSYPSRIEAIKAAKALPANWGAPNPWVRSFLSLHGEPQK